MKRAVVAVLAAVLLVPGAVAGQEPEREVFVDSFRGAPELGGYVSDSGYVVLDDRSFCAYVLGGTFGSGENINTDVSRWDLQDFGFDKKGVTKSLKKHSSQPITNELLLDACVHNLTQFLHPDLSFAEVMYPDDPDIAEMAPDPPEWQALPVLPRSVVDALKEVTR